MAAFAAVSGKGLASACLKKGAVQEFSPHTKAPQIAPVAKQPEAEPETPATPRANGQPSGEEPESKPHAEPSGEEQASRPNAEPSGEEQASKPNAEPSGEEQASKPNAEPSGEETVSKPAAESGLRASAT